MDKEYYNQAAAYFAGVWQEHSQTWEAGKIEPAQIEPAISTTTPVCLSLIARVTKQNMVNQAILSIRNQLLAISQISISASLPLVCILLIIKQLESTRLNS